MRRITRREVKNWLSPVRNTLEEMKGGYADELNGHAVTRLDDDDNYGRIDFCLAGFRLLLNRLCDIDLSSLVMLENKLQNQEYITNIDIDNAFSSLNQCEDAIIKLSREAVQSIVLTEQISIEQDSLKDNPCILMKN